MMNHFNRRSLIQPQHEPAKPNCQPISTPKYINTIPIMSKLEILAKPSTQSQTQRYSKTKIQSLCQAKQGFQQQQKEILHEKYQKKQTFLQIEQLYEQIELMKQKQKQLERINNVLVATLRKSHNRSSFQRQNQSWKYKYEKLLKQMLSLQKEMIIVKQKKEKFQSNLDLKPQVNRYLVNRSNKIQKNKQKYVKLIKTTSSISKMDSFMRRVKKYDVTSAKSKDHYQNTFYNASHIINLQQSKNLTTTNIKPTNFKYTSKQMSATMNTTSSHIKQPKTKPKLSSGKNLINSINFHENQNSIRNIKKISQKKLKFY